MLLGGCYAMQKKQVILQEDGFSFHTFSVRYFMEEKEFEKIFSHLKTVSDRGEFYKPSYFQANCWVCSHFSEEGLLLYLSTIHDDKGNSHHIATCRINPRKLIDPDCSYYGIMHRDKKSLDRMEVCFRKVLHKAGINRDLNDGTLYRFDLCGNLMFLYKKLPRIIMDCLSRSSINGNYRLTTTDNELFFDPMMFPKRSLRIVPRGQNEDSMKNSIALVLYDKQAQMKENHLFGTAEKKRKERSYGILRIELHLEGKKIRELTGKNKTTREQIEYLSGRSRELLTEYTGKVFPTGDFYSLAECKKLIDGGNFKEKMRKRMRRIVEAIAEGDTFLEALDDCEEDLSGKKIIKTMENFDRLGMNAVPLPKKAKPDYLPSVYRMLQALDGEQAVTFKSIKEKTCN